MNFCQFCGHAQNYHILDKGCYKALEFLVCCQCPKFVGKDNK